MDTTPPQTYTYVHILSIHGALPISSACCASESAPARRQTAMHRRWRRPKPRPSWFGPVAGDTGGDIIQQTHRITNIDDAGQATVGRHHVVGGKIGRAS